MTARFTAITAAFLLTACSAEQSNHDNSGAVDHTAHSGDATTANLTDAQRAYTAVNNRMHAAMAEVSEDPDVAFMQGMLAHHRGAVEMSQVALEYGEDAQVRDLAQRIIDAQQAEIREMEEWLEARAGQ